MKLNDANTVRELSDVLVSLCTEALPNCGEVTPTVFIRHDDQLGIGVLADGVNDEVLAMVGKLAAEVDSHLIGVTVEAWMASYGEGTDTSVMPAKRADKREIVAIGVGDRKGDVLVRIFGIVRDGEGKPSLGPEEERAGDVLGGRIYDLLAGGPSTKH